jgi:hypothetical protein
VSGAIVRLLVAFLLALYAVASADAHPPYGLVADARGNLYFSDLEAVWRLTPEGRLELFRPASEGHHVHELAPGPNGSIEGVVNSYDPATETFAGGLWTRSFDGRETWLLAPTGTPPRGLGVYSDARGNRYTAQWPSQQDRRTMLFRRSPDARVDLLHGPADAAARFRQVLVESVGGMAALPDGGMAFADGPALRRVDPSGAVATLYEGPEGASFRGVSVTADGRILAADFAGKTVVAVTRDGAAEILHRETEAWLPTAAVIAGGRLLVLEANAAPREYVDRVRVIEVANGRGREIARPARPAPAPEPPAGAAETAGFGWRLAVVLALAAAATIAWVRWRRLRR